MIVINNNKAIEITKEKIRTWRESEFKVNDIKLQNALVDGNETAKQEAVEHRDYLRDLPAQCEGKNLEELKALMSELGI